MPLISVIIVLIVVGVLLWLVNTYLPMDQKHPERRGRGRGRALVASGFWIVGISGKHSGRPLTASMLLVE
jgi:hypothetical protein